ncbi:LPS export ABC transporter permease LptG [soil metagenome]
MHTLDRTLFVTFLRSYLIVLTCVLSLYIVIDLFTNLEAFIGRGGGLLAISKHIAAYYGVRVTQIFDRLCEVIVLLAAMFTVAWMQRSNELLPQLSAGISTQRVLRPLLIGTGLMLAFGPLNQEMLIPRIADELQVPRDDPDQQRPIEMRGAYDSSGVHVEGLAGFRKDKRIKGFFVTFPESGAAGMVHLHAEEAVFVKSDVPNESGWMLYNVLPELSEPLPEQLEARGPRRFFLKLKDIDFDSMTRGSSVYALASTTKLQDVLAMPDQRRQPAVAVLFHMRFVRPLIGVVLVVLGLAIILRDQNRHVLVSSGLCLVMCAIYYGAVYGCKYLGENDLLSAPLAAWLPVIVFGPIAVVQFDSMQT